MPVRWPVTSGPLRINKIIMDVKEMGRLGGIARAKKLTAKQRKQSSQKAIKERWRLYRLRQAK